MALAIFLIITFLRSGLGGKCKDFRKDLCQDPGSLCQISSFEDCPCAEGFWPQIDSFTEPELRFGCCPGNGVTACGPQRTSMTTCAQVTLAQALLCILLTTLVIHHRQPRAWRIKSGDSALENSSLVLDGAKLHAEVPMERWCISLEDLKQFKRLVSQAVSDGRISPTEMNPFDPTDYSIGPSMYTVTEQYIKPVTAAAGNVSWALMKHPSGLPCDVFITHAWAEGVFEFIDKVFSSWPQGGRAAYVCFLSNPQNLDIADLISTPEQSPFAKALDSCRHVIAVPNRVCSIYSRLWCVYEAFLAYTWNKPITNATSLDFNAWAYLLRIFFIGQVSASAGLLLPLRLATRCYLPTTTLVMPFMVLFLLSLGQCGGYKPHLQKFAVIGTTIFANVSYACDVSMGRALFDENWLFAVEYICLGVFGTIAMELDRLNSLSADKAAEDLRRGFSGHLSEAGCSDETDRLKILEEVKKSGHETDVEETVKMLIKMSISTPELRATVERTGTLTDAAHWRGEGHPAYYLVSVCILPPLLLALSILGPAQTARIPFVGPRLVRLVFGKPRCLKRWGRPPGVFLASESVQENNTQRLLQMLNDLDLHVITSEDTKPTHGGPSSAHVAIDVTICARASHFLGTATSSLSALIGSLRYAANRTGETASYFPRLPRVDLEEYELGLFPLSSSLPSEGELQHFFHGLETKVSAASSRSFFDCSVDARREGQRGSPRYGSGMAIVNTVLPFGEERTSAVLVTRDLIEYAWQESAWSCPPVALIAYMQLLVGLQNASRWGPAAGFDPTSPHELYLEKVRFVYKLWQMLSIGSWNMAAWSAPGVKYGVQQLLRSLAQL
ncbi:unnamed protein product [Durusdinium trenchii]|uniref:Uncharacterized protein n=1 Tax=Durusdinium trenchii TaxID=1381693 RepID=A0ABP0KZS2_9DINO